MRNSAVHEDVYKFGSRACITDYCYKQDMCSDKCKLSKLCFELQLKYGVDEGEFDRWTIPQLKSAMRLINGGFTIEQFGRTTVSIREKNK